MDSASVTITCLTVSRPSRLSSLRLAVDDFCRQNHPRKELIIIVDDAEYAREVNEFVRHIGESIYLLTVSTALPLGVLRNIGLEHSHGEVVCQWDDDDRYSPERITLQLQGLCSSGAHACFLHQQLHFFYDTRELFWTDWRYHEGRPVAGALSRIIPGTVMCKSGAALYPEEGDLVSKGEDSVYAATLIKSGAIGLEAPPGTYLRTYHGQNTWDRAHHRTIAVGRSVAADAMDARRQEIEETLSYFKIPSPVRVMAGNRLAFLV